jgi:hypothetical protein
MFPKILNIFAVFFTHDFFSLMPRFLAKIIHFYDHCYRMLVNYSYYSEVEQNEVEMLNICNKSMRYDGPNEKAEYVKGEIALEKAWIISTSLASLISLS